jgi:uncharacterized NAD-dependent epimerase/dehydratase family protein
MPDRFPEMISRTAFPSLLSHKRIVLLTDGYSTPFLAKTAISMLRYRTADVVAVFEQQSTAKTAGELLGVGGEIPVISNLANADEIDAIYIGIAPPGGKLPVEWRGVICDALWRGIDVVSGLHDFLNDDAEYVRLAKESGCQLVDIRRNYFKQTATRRVFPKASVRIHSVGHDCSVGKMVASLEMQKGLCAAGRDAKFIATGQTGIMISGEGVPIDCVISDFVNGAIEGFIAENEKHDFLLIEGQGSIAHPAFSAVTAGLLHGCAPDGLIFVYEAGRQFVKGLDEVPIVPIRQQIDALQAMANLRHKCKLIGFAINTRTLSAEEAADEIAKVEKQFGLPACDVYREGPSKLVAAAIQLREEIMQS